MDGMAEEYLYNWLCFKVDAEERDERRSRYQKRYRRKRKQHVNKSSSIFSVCSWCKWQQILNASLKGHTWATSKCVSMLINVDSIIILQWWLLLNNTLNKEYETKDVEYLEGDSQHSWILRKKRKRRQSCNVVCECSYGTYTGKGCGYGVLVHFVRRQLKLCT